MNNLILVRHGQSEGNVARHRSLVHGDHSYYTPEFTNRHSSTWLLTNKGREQAKAAGEWIKKNLSDVRIDRHYTSEYLRAMETAALLELPGAIWFAETFLRERDFGVLDLLSEEDRQRLYPGEMERRKRDR